MSIRYHDRRDRRIPDYVCQSECIEKGMPKCQSIRGEGIDEAIGQLLIESVTPLALEVVLEVQQQIETCLADAQRLRLQHLQRLQYDADRARLRYMRVDPDNRLVADTLEAQWNEKLRLLAEAKETAQRQHRLDACRITEEQKDRIRALAADFPRMWRDPQTSDRERKRIARLLLEDVTLSRDRNVLVQVRFRGGAARELRLPLPQRSCDRWRTPGSVVAEVDRLLDRHGDAEVAGILEERGLKTGAGGRFDAHKIGRLRRQYRLKSRRERLQSQGWITVRQMASLLGCPLTVVTHWRTVGLLSAIRFSSRSDLLYQPPSDEIIAKIRSRLQPFRWKPLNPQPGIKGVL
jgi:hypothetical protein